MDETQDYNEPTEQELSSAVWWGSDSLEKFGSLSFYSQEDSLSNKESPRNYEGASSSQTASDILWRTGVFSERIPNGFYCVIPDRRLKEFFEAIPTLDELYSLGIEGLRADIIVVDTKKDKKLCMLKQLIVALVKGLHSNSAGIIKKIAVLVSDFYKRPNGESPVKAASAEATHTIDKQDMHFLGQIKHGSCRPRAILFKVLADTVGLESRIMVGLPAEGSVHCVDSCKHMSVTVVVNSMELLVDLMRFPGQLIPRTTKAIFMTHISAAGESDSADNDSCDSPLEPNSPLFGFCERPDPDGSEKVEGLQLCGKSEVSSSVSGPSFCNMMRRSIRPIDEKFSLSHSEPDIATTFWRRSRKKVIAEQRTASSSPERRFFRVHGRSILSGNQNMGRDYTDDVGTSRSDGASSFDARRMRRRSFSMTPQIGDDIVRTVRAMNEIIKQNRTFSDGENKPFSTALDTEDNSSYLHERVVGADFIDCEETASANPALYGPQRNYLKCQRAISLPSSPHDYKGIPSEKSEHLGCSVNEEFMSIWNKVVESHAFHGKPILLFKEWNIDFSELTVGTRVGIGFFGEVFRGIWNGTDVAIKVFLEQDLTAENMHDFCNEISILSRLRHPNVILFLGACIKPPCLSMVTEYMEMGSLYYLIHLSGQKKKLSWRRRLKMLRDICRGLMCIHRMNIVHRDLKSANCLVNKHWAVKICDFGLSRIVTEMPMRETSSAGTPEWMAPELIRNEPFTEKCDIFSLGVIIWELSTLNRPWEGVPPARVVYAVAHEGTRLEIAEGPLSQLITDCLGEAEERPNCEQILARLLDCEYSMC